MNKSFLIRFGRRVILKNSWKVKNKKDAVNALEGLLNSDAIYRFNNITEDATDEYIAKVRAFCAWDLQRVMLVGGFAYLADYLTFEEALDFSLEACKQIQSIFTSWDDYNTNYLAGNMMWAGADGQTPRNRKLIYEHIIKNEINPWNVSWDTNLKREW